MISGIACGCGERTWIKWIPSPSMPVVNCAERASGSEIGGPGLACGGALRGPWREASLAYGLGDFAHFLRAPPSMLDDALEVIGALLFPIDAGIGFLKRREHRILDAIGAGG